jgi:hypothetical protein
MFLLGPPTDLKNIAEWREKNEYDFRNMGKWFNSTLHKGV